MNSFDREEFRAWLRSLPPDESFCTLDTCPVAMYHGVVLSDSISNGYAMRIDPELTDQIDDISDGGNWDTLTPDDVLTLMRRL